MNRCSSRRSAASHLTDTETFSVVHRGDNVQFHAPDGIQLHASDYVYSIFTRRSTQWRQTAYIAVAARLHRKLLVLVPVLLLLLSATLVAVSSWASDVDRKQFLPWAKVLTIGIDADQCHRSLHMAQHEEPSDLSGLTAARDSRCALIHRVARQIHSIIITCEVGYCWQLTEEPEMNIIEATGYTDI